MPFETESIKYIEQKEFMKKDGMLRSPMIISIEMAYLGRYVDRKC